MNLDSPTPNSPVPTNPNSNRTKIIAVVATLAICLIGLAVYTLSQGKTKSTSQSSSSSKSSGGTQPSASPLPSSNPPKEVIAVVTKYVQARENSVGADQATTTSWVASVKPISTAAWFALLQPAQAGTAGDASGEFNLAHTNHYVVTPTLTKCIWDFEVALPTPSSGTVYCELSDATNDLSSKAVVSADALPFGWTHNGTQAPVTVKLLKQGGVWLIDDDSSSNVPD